MPRRSEAYMEARRSQIIDAARTCLLASDWARATVDQVAAAAGVSKGAVYTHFATKRDLLIGLVQSNLDEIEIWAKAQSLDDLRHEFDQGLVLLAGPQGRAIARGQMELILEGVRDPEANALIRQITGRLTQIFTDFVARLRTDLTPAEARLRALSLIFLVEGMRSCLATTDALSETDLRAVIERALTTLAD